MAIAVRGPRLPVLPQPRLDVAFLAPALAVVAAFELVVLRAGTRTAIHIPALDVLAEPYRAVAWTGRYSYYLAAILLALALPVVAVHLWRREGDAGRVAGVGVVCFMAAAAAIRAGVGGPVFLDLATVSLVMLLAFVAAVTRGRRGPLLLVYAAAFGLSAGHVIVQDAVAEGVATAYDGRWMLELAEPLALAFALSLPWALGAEPGRRGWLAGAAVGAVVLMVFLGEPFTARFLLLWNSGLAGTYPGVVYAIAAGVGAAAVVALLRGRRIVEAAAAVLLIAGGVGLHSTYQTGLVLVAFALLVAARREEQPSPGLTV